MGYVPHVVIVQFDWGGGGGFESENLVLGLSLSGSLCSLYFITLTPALEVYEVHGGAPVFLGTFICLRIYISTHFIDDQSCVTLPFGTFKTANIREWRFASDMW